MYQGMLSVVEQAAPLVAAFANGQGAFFIGSGLSLAAGYPDWNELATRVTLRLTGIAPVTRDPIQAFDELVASEEFAKEEVRSEVVWWFSQLKPRQPRDEGMETYRLLCRFPVRYWFTTNYDRLCCDALRDADREVSHVFEASFLRTVRDRDVVVYALNGSVEYPPTMTITTADRKGRLASSDRLYEAMRWVASNHAILFLGYSFREPLVRDILQPAEAGGRRHYALFLAQEEADEARACGYLPEAVVPLVLPPMPGQTDDARVQKFLRLLLQEAKLHPRPVDRRVARERGRAQLQEACQKQVSSVVHALSREARYQRDTYAQRLEDYVLRGFLESALGGEQRNCLFVVGEPGCGKTSLVCRALQSYLYKLNRPAVTLTAREFGAFGGRLRVRHISQVLARALTDRGVDLFGEDWSVHTPEDLRNAIVQRPDEPLLVVIDGLDEIHAMTMDRDESDRPKRGSDERFPHEPTAPIGAEALASFLEQLPREHVRVIVTSRPRTWEEHYAKEERLARFAFNPSGLLGFLDPGVPLWLHRQSEQPQEAMTQDGAASTAVPVLQLGRFRESEFCLAMGHAQLATGVRVQLDPDGPARASFKDPYMMGICFRAWQKRRTDPNRHYYVPVSGLRKKEDYLARGVSSINWYDMIGRSWESAVTEVADRGDQPAARLEAMRAVVGAMVDFVLENRTQAVPYAHVVTAAGGDRELVGDAMDSDLLFWEGTGDDRGLGRLRFARPQVTAYHVTARLVSRLSSLGDQEPFEATIRPYLELAESAEVFAFVVEDAVRQLLAADGKRGEEIARRLIWHDAFQPQLSLCMLRIAQQHGQAREHLEGELVERFAEWCGRKDEVAMRNERAVRELLLEMPHLIPRPEGPFADRILEVWAQRGTLDKSSWSWDVSMEHQWHNRGNDAYKQNAFGRAISCYCWALRLKPDLLETYFNRGLAYTRLQQYDQAIEELDRVVELNPHLAEAYYTRGLVRGYRLEYDDAIRDYERALEVDPGYSKASTEMESARDKLRRLAGFDGDADREQTEGPPGKPWESGWELLRAGRYGEVEQLMKLCYAELRKNPDLADIASFLELAADLSCRVGRTSAGAERYLATLQFAEVLKPDDLSRLLNNLGTCYGARNLDDATPLYLAALAADGRDYVAQCNFAGHITDRLQYADALIETACASRFAEGDNSPLPAYTRGSTYLAMEDEMGAAACFEKAQMQEGVSAAWAAYWLAQMKAGNADRPEEARPFFARALELFRRWESQAPEVYQLVWLAEWYQAMADCASRLGDERATGLVEMAITHARTGVTTEQCEGGQPLLYCCINERKVGLDEFEASCHSLLQTDRRGDHPVTTS